MEHRWGRRVSADLKVQILAAPASAGWGRLRDISLSGGFIETALRIPTLSKLCMTVPGVAHRSTRTVHAIVVRKEVDGVGIEWLDSDSGTVAALMQDVAAWRTLKHARHEMRL
jgi:hypothetical protein